MELLDAVVAACAVVGAALGVWNFWKAEWGSRPRYAAQIEHMEGATFRLRKTGRRDFTAKLGWLLPVEVRGWTSMPDLIELTDRTPITFTLELVEGAPYPASLQMYIHGARDMLGATMQLIVDLPYSPEAHQSAQELWRKQFRPE